MDFSYTEEQQAIFDLAAQILQNGATQERLREIEDAAGPRFDPELWDRFGEAGLVGVGIPEAYDGGGLGFLEVAGVMEHIGRTTAPIPFFETAVLGASAIAEFGSEAMKQAVLPDVAAGNRILTAALVEAETPIEAPRTRAQRERDGWRIDGAKAFVPAAELADQILVPATTDEGLTVFLVDRRSIGLSLEPLATTSGMPEAMMILDGVRVDDDAVLGEVGQGEEIVSFIDLRANAALCNLALGVCEAALELTAEYSKTRKQFDQPIAMFQSVSHREADAYIDTQSVRLSALEVAWMISAGRDASEEVAIAKHYASDAGYRVTFSAQHIHGGIGVDREYPVHRYYLYARHLELTLGGSTHHLRRLGRMIAATATAAIA
jgi:acyl-CoA dehydrogenase